MTSNSKKGKEFERQVGDYLRSNGIEVVEDYEVEIGINGQHTKTHKFDLGNESLLVECKRYTWTKGNNNPSAKLSTANEAMLYFLAAPESYQKMLFMSETDRMGKRHPETLAGRYVKTYKHLFPDSLAVWEFNEDSLSASQLWPLAATSGDIAREVQVIPQKGNKEKRMGNGSIPESYRRDSGNSARGSLAEDVWNEVIDHWFTPAKNRGERSQRCVWRGPQATRMVQSLRLGL